MKKILTLAWMMMLASLGTKAEVLLDSNDGDDDGNVTNSHTYNVNGLNVSFVRSARVVNVTFNSPCDNAEVVIYKDGVPVDEDNIGSVDAGTTETYSVDGYGKGTVSVSVVRDGKEVWINNLTVAE